MRIRRRLVLYGTGVATLGMVIFAVLLAGALARGVDDDQAFLLDALAGDAAAAAEAIDADGLAGREPLTRADLATSTEPFTLILDADGAVLYATAELDGTAPAIPAAVIVEALRTGRSSATIDLGSELTALVAARSWTSGSATGVAVAGRSTTFIAEQVAGVRVFLLISAIIAIVAVAIVTFLVVGRALRPLRTLAATADEIARTGDLSRRLPAVPTRDEVGTLTASFNGMLDRVEGAQAAQAEVLAAQRRFVADASHELRTPLTSIRANAGFLRDRPDAQPADRADAVADIEAEADRLSRLVDDLLLLARSDAGGGASIVRERRPVDLAVVAADVARVAGRTARPVRAVTSGAAIVEGDPDAMTRLVWILVDNGLRHGTGALTVSVAVTDVTVTMTVDDEGPGIPLGGEMAIFERFHRADRARSGPGAGLGLAIARAIVLEHGGSISAATRVEGGARLTVSMPAG